MRQAGARPTGHHRPVTCHGKMLAEERWDRGADRRGRRRIRNVERRKPKLSRSDISGRPAEDNVIGGTNARNETDDLRIERSRGRADIAAANLSARARTTAEGSAAAVRDATAVFSLRSTGRRYAGRDAGV